MFCKKMPKNKDGKILLIYAESYRVPNGYKTNTKGKKVKDYKIRQKKIETIGYVEDFLNKYDDPFKHFQEEAKRITKANEERDLNNLISVEYNTQELYEIKENKHDLYNLGYILINAIYHELEIDYLWNNRRQKTDKKFNHNMIFLLLVIDRIIYSSSKRKALSYSDRFFENFNFTENDIYRSLSFFSKYKVDLLKVLNDRVIKRYDRNTELLFYDVTNYYFEIDEEDDLRKKGVSKEHRPNPIVQMGLFMDDKGMPISYHKFAGNKNDSTTFIPSIETTGFDLNYNNVIYIADKGMMSGNNISRIIREKSGYIISYSVRKAKSKFQKWVLDKADYNEWVDKNGVYYKQKSRITTRNIKIDSFHKQVDGSYKIIQTKQKINERQIAFYSSAYDKKSKKDREKTIDKAKRIAAGESSSTILNKGAMSLVTNTTINKETGEIKNKEWKNLKDFNDEKLKEMEKFDGYYVITTNVIGLEDKEKTFKSHHQWTKDGFYKLNRVVSDSDIINMYKGLWKIEESFKITKSSLNTRPMYVRKEEHIEAHLLVCFTALLILRALENRSGLNAMRIQELIQNYQVDEVATNLFKTTYFNSELFELGKSVGLDLRKKQYTRMEIRNIIAESKRFGKF